MGSADVCFTVGQECMAQDFTEIIKLTVTKVCHNENRLHLEAKGDSGFQQDAISYKRLTCEWSSP